MPAVVDRRLGDVPDRRDVEQLKHDLALQKELVAQLDQRVRTQEALQRQDPARGGPIRKWDAWRDNDNDAEARSGPGETNECPAKCCWRAAVVVTASEGGCPTESPTRAVALPPPGRTACGEGAHRRWPMFFPHRRTSDRTACHAPW